MTRSVAEQAGALNSQSPTPTDRAEASDGRNLRYKDTNRERRSSHEVGGEGGKYNEVRLPRYYLHIRGADGTAASDEEGTDLADLEAAHADAVEAARELFAAAIKLARDPMLKSIVITDEAGTELGEVRIKDLLPPSFWE